MFFDPRALFMMAVLVGVTGWVVRGLMMSLVKIRRDDRSAATNADLDERLRKIEAAVSGVIMDVAAMREKERFMTRLQASRELQTRQESTMEGELSPLVTQNIPVIPRVGR